SDGAMTVLPIDVAAATHSRDGWRQFPLLEYGLCTQTPRPANSDPYWSALEETTKTELGPEDRARADQLATELIEATTEGNQQAVDEFLATADRVAKGADALRSQTEALIAKTGRDLQAAARTRVELEQESLRLQQLLRDAQSHPAFPQLIKELLER